MTPEEAPVGTVCVVGHPANGVTATKYDDGDWYYNGQTAGTPGWPNRRRVDFDTVHKDMRAVYIPGRT